MSGFYVHGIVQRFLDWLVMFRAEPEHARVSAPRRRPGRLGRPESTFPSRPLGSSEDKAFLITVPAIDAFYWNFQPTTCGKSHSTTDASRHGQQTHRPLRGRRHSPNRREPHRSGLGQLISTAHHITAPGAVTTRLSRTSRRRSNPLMSSVIARPLGRSALEERGEAFLAIFAREDRVQRPLPWRPSRPHRRPRRSHRVP